MTDLKFRLPAEMAAAMAAGRGELVLLAPPGPMTAEIAGEVRKLVAHLINVTERQRSTIETLAGTLAGVADTANDVAARARAHAVATAMAVRTTTPQPEDDDNDRS